MSLDGIALKNLERKKIHVGQEHRAGVALNPGQNVVRENERQWLVIGILKYQRICDGLTGYHSSRVIAKVPSLANVSGHRIERILTLLLQVHIVLDCHKALRGINREGKQSRQNDARNRDRSL